MKKCLKCQKEFSIRLMLEGKIHNLCSRRFCLECSPWKKHNTKNLLKNAGNIIDGKKKCAVCNETFEANSKNFYIKKNGNIFSYCKKCNNKRTTEKQKETKRKCIEYLGGKCVCCGYDKYDGALEFHHVDRTKKSFNISTRHNCDFETLKAELDKCILVCANCHREIEGKVTECPVKN